MNGSNQALMALMIEQLQATTTLSERIAKLEVEVFKLQAGQMRIMAFAGIIGTAIGFASGHINQIVKYLKGLFA